MEIHITQIIYCKFHLQHNINYVLLSNNTQDKQRRAISYDNDV